MQMPIVKQFARIMVFPVLLGSLVVLSGCASTGELKGYSSQANVNLEKKNYKMIKVGARGDSYGFRLFGLIPIVSPSFADAKESLYESFGQPMEGRAIALVNRTEDKSNLYLILFSIPKVTITADVIEYTDEKEK